MPAKTIAVSTATGQSAPLKKLSNDSTKSIINSDVFPSDIKSPAKMKKGTAIKANESIPANILWGTITNGIFPKRRIIKEEVPIAIAMGIPKIKNKLNVVNNSKNTMPALICFLPP